MLIQENDRKVLIDIFSERLVNPVKLVMFTQKKSKLILPSQPETTDDCQYCNDTEELVKEVAELSSKITTEIYDFKKDDEKVKEFSIDKIPAIAICGKKDYGIRYYGIPVGYEFSTLIDDITDVSNGNTDLSDETKSKLKVIDKDIHIQVFSTPT
jgi:glutaredoxin-like protein